MIGSYRLTRKAITNGLLIQMINIQYSESGSPIPPHLFKEYLGRLAGSQAAKIERFHRWEDAQASLIGLLMIEEGFKKLGLPYTAKDIRYTELGRPFVPGSVDFNVSHSGSIVVCAFSNVGKIGVDIELIQPINTSDFDAFFAREEIDKTRNEIDGNYWFYYYWTIKEAAVKLIGEGLHFPLSDVRIEDEHIKIGQSRYYFKTINISSAYMFNIVSDVKIHGAVDLEKWHSG